MLLDFQLPDRNGLEILKDIRERDPEMAVIMITAYGTPENAVAAIQGGAANFIAKPWTNEKLQADVRAAIGRKRVQEENIQLKRQLKQRYNFENIIGKSELMLRTFDLVAQVAPSRSTILLQGESGTGKELIAKAIHANSPRKDRPFVPVNTGSMPSDLLESTLFGHVKGAFTCAVSSKKGLFEMADRGTIFLDEIGNMSHGDPGQAAARAAGQALHASGRSAGDSGGRARYRRHQQRAAAGGKRRQVPRRPLLPPQRHHHRAASVAQSPGRHTDAGATLPAQVLRGERKARAKPGAGRAARLMDYAWPGNMRELENAIERAVVLSAHPVITADLFP